MPDKNHDTNFLAHGQYKTAENVNLRWDLYKTCVPRIDIHKTGLDRLGLNGTEDILEVGCAAGDVLLELRKARKHGGRLVGLEINDTITQPTVDYMKTHPALQPIEFVVGSGDVLPFSEASFDVIIGFFMLYHLPDIGKALQEWRRVLRPGGKLLVSTASRYNRPKGKHLKERVAEIAHVKSFDKFSTTFDLENGRTQLEEQFKVLDAFIYDGEMRIADPELYLASLSSDRDMYTPPPGDQAWHQAQAYARRLIEGEIAEHGFFVDPVKRGFFICEKS